MIKEKKILSKLLVLLAFVFCYRLLIHLLMPGVPFVFLSSLISENKVLSGLFSVISAGGLKQLSVLTLGLMPYISASIIMQILAMPFGISHLVALKKEAGGQLKINKYTRFLTVVIAVVQSIAFCFSLNVRQGIDISNFLLLSYAAVVIALVFGAVFLMWLGERLTLIGLGNGISLLILFGILSEALSVIISIFSAAGVVDFFVTVLVFGMLLLLCCAVEMAQRRVSISKSSAAVGAFGVLPFKLNSSGVIPAIFASSLMIIPSFFVSVFPDSSVTSSAFSYGSFLYSLFFIALLVVFSFFYAFIVVNPREISDSMRKSSMFIPGMRPGVQTETYISDLVRSLALFGSIYIAVVCVIPMLIYSFGFSQIAFSGTSILIVVVVLLEFISQLQLLMHSEKYSGLLKNSGFLKTQTSTVL